MEKEGQKKQGNFIAPVFVQLCADLASWIIQLVHYLRGENWNLLHFDRTANIDSTVKIPYSAVRAATRFDYICELKQLPVNYRKSVNLWARACNKRQDATRIVIQNERLVLNSRFTHHRRITIFRILRVSHSAYEYFHLKFQYAS